jgi:hypothetical protein
MKFIVFTLATFLAGCSLTPEQAQALASGMHSAGQGLSQEAAQMRQQMYQQNQNSYQQMPRIAPMPTTCSTTYNSMMRAYETRCQ